MLIFCVSEICLFVDRWPFTRWPLYSLLLSRACVSFCATIDTPNAVGEEYEGEEVAGEDQGQTEATGKPPF